MKTDAIGFLDPLALPRVAWRSRELLWQMTKRVVLQRYRGSFLGVAWSFAHPLLMLSVYTFVFTVVFKARWGADVAGASGGRGAFAVIMFCGMTVYSLFSEAVTGSCLCVVSSPNFVKKVIFPLEVLPLAQVLATFVLGLAWFALLILGALLLVGGLPATALLLPVLVVPLFAFSLGVSYLVAALGVYLRDLPHLLGVVLQVLFFATPIFYPLDAVPARFRTLLALNPLTVFIEQVRGVLFFGRLPDGAFFVLASLVSLLALQFGFVCFAKAKRGFADVL